MAKPRDHRAEALAALMARINELSIRLDHAKLMRDVEKIESVTRKLGLAMNRAARLKRKVK